MYNLSIFGWMTESELQIIERWASAVKPNGVIVECGSHVGRSSYCWAKSCDPSVKVYCIDFFKENQNVLYQDEPLNMWQEFCKNTKECNNIIPLRGVSPTGIMYPGDKIDVFFIDAAHTNPDDYRNIRFFQKFFKKDTLICGHDYSTIYPDVIENAKYLADFYKKELVLYKGTLLWSIQT